MCYTLVTPSLLFCVLWSLWPQVLSVTLSTIKNCEEFKQQYNKYDFLWKQDLHQTLQVCIALQANLALCKSELVARGRARQTRVDVKAGRRLSPHSLF
jgi:hypothetical protein